MSLTCRFLCDFRNGDVLVLESIPVIQEASISNEVSRKDERNGAENASSSPADQQLGSILSIPETTKKLTRKRQVHKSEWKSNIRKQKYQAGKEYISRRGKLVQAKKVVNKKDCMNNCKFNCAKLISDQQRLDILKCYYSLDQNGKLCFLIKTTERNLTKRPKQEVSRRSFTFTYYFDVHDNRFQVCKNFYLGTLNISQKPVYNVHKNKNMKTDFANVSKRGKSRGNKMPQQDIDIVIGHINMFPRVASHYCRADTKKEYLDPNLNIKKMYQLYVEYCNEELNIQPVKQSMYRNIFCSEFNLDFHHRKKDLCITCEESNLAIKESRELSADKEESIKRHKEMKIKMREHKNQDKEGNIPILCFDLQNVITLPISNVGNFFYLPKLTCYNLTGHLSKTKKVYNAVWTEYTGGRTGNDLASALTVILEQILNDHPEMKDLITWSDSCVPQNKNSIMSYAILNFLKHHPSIKTITMKYSVPGHSAVQEVDNAHSQIDRTLSNNDIFSPVGLIRVLKTVNPKFKFIQVLPTHFKDFGMVAKSKTFDFKKIPYTKVVSLRYTQNLSSIGYKCHYYNEFVECSIKVQKRTGRMSINFEELFPDPKVIIKTSEIAADKRAALKSMMPMMLQQDQDFYKTILKL